MANVRLADYANAKSDIGLGNVNNTSDANKPISTATQAALDLKANISSLGTAAAENVGFFATAAQGALADAAALRTTSTAAVSAAGVLTLNYALGDYFTVALSEDVSSIVISNLPGAGRGATLMVRFTQDATPRTVAWPAAFTWAGGSAGAVSTGSGDIDVLALTTFDNGTSWQVTLAKAYA